MLLQIDLHAADIDGADTARLQRLDGGNRIGFRREERAYAFGIDGPWPGHNHAVYRPARFNLGNGAEEGIGDSLVELGRGDGAAAQGRGTLLGRRSGRDGLGEDEEQQEGGSHERHPARLTLSDGYFNDTGNFIMLHRKKNYLAQDLSYPLERRGGVPRHAASWTFPP
jgi:hypothetical protein